MTFKFSKQIWFNKNINKNGAGNTGNAGNS
jgi:hypothetical protein